MKSLSDSSLSNYHFLFDSHSPVADSAIDRRGLIYTKKKMVVDQSDDHLFSFPNMTLTERLNEKQIVFDYFSRYVF